MESCRSEWTFFTLFFLQEKLQEAVTKLRQLEEECVHQKAFRGKQITEWNVSVRVLRLLLFSGPALGVGHDWAKHSGRLPKPDQTGDPSEKPCLSLCPNFSSVGSYLLSLRPLSSGRPGVRRLLGEAEPLLPFTESCPSWVCGSQCLRVAAWLGGLGHVPYGAVCRSQTTESLTAG